MKRKLIILGTTLALLATAFSMNACAKYVSNTGNTVMNEDDFDKDSNPDSIANFKKIPEFTAKTIDGETVDNSIFKGSKLTVVNVWGTFCKPCIQEMPELQKVYESMKEKGVNMVGIVQDGNEKTDDAKEILKESGVSFKNILPDGGLEKSVANTMIFPLTLLVDSEGNVVGEPISGGNTQESLTKKIEEVLKKM